MQKEDLERILDGEITHIKHVKINEPCLSHVEVIVLPSHVKRVIEAYLDGEINKESLNAWAEFVCFRDEFVCKNCSDDNNEADAAADYYENMWYVIQKLSTPEIDGEITSERVRDYLDEMDKYFDKNGNEIDYI